MLKTAIVSSIAYFPLYAQAIASLTRKLIHNLSCARLFKGAEDGDEEDRFKVLLGEVSGATEVVGQLQFRVKALEDALLIASCRAAEEQEGRVNSEATNRVIIKGKKVPYLQPGDDLQPRLKAQV